MLRINLLPSYVTQRRLTKRLTIGFALLFILCVGVPLALYVTMKQHLADITQQADTAQTAKEANDALAAQAVSTLAQVDPIKAKLDFVDAAHKSIRSWVGLYNTLADQSPKSSFIYTDASVSGPTMTIKAYSPSVEEVGRYLQAMYHESDFQTVTVDHVPGYPDNVQHLYYLDGRMVFADGATGSSGASGAASGPAGSQGSSAAGPANYTPQSLGPNAAGNVPPDVGPPPPELTGGAPSGGTSTGQATGGYSPAFLAVASRNISPFAPPDVRDQILRTALRRVVMKTIPKGFDITVTATLKDPVQKELTPPALPGTPPAAGAGNQSGFGPGGAAPTG